MSLPATHMLERHVSYSDTYGYCFLLHYAMLIFTTHDITARRHYTYAVDIAIHYYTTPPPHTHATPPPSRGIERVAVAALHAYCRAVLKCALFFRVSAPSLDTMLILDAYCGYGAYAPRLFASAPHCATPYYMLRLADHCMAITATP